MKASGKTIISLMLAAELLLGPAWAAGPVVAAEAVLAGTPYATNGSYDVSVPHIIVNQVYGIGDSTATGGYFSSGFIELYNPTDSNIDLNGWSIQYSDPSPNVNGLWSKLDLNGIIKAHSSYLITDSKNDLSSANNISAKGDQSWPAVHFFNKGMKVVLLSDTTLLQVANPYQNKTNDYVDMIGTAGNENGLTIDGFEGDYPTGSSGGTSKKKSVRRDTFTDTDNNKADFKQITFETTLDINRPHSSTDGQWGVVVPELGLSTMSIPNARIGSPYSVTLAVYGGLKPYTFEATGLPNGLSLDTASGSISGTPTVAGTSTVSISVYDNSTIRMFAEEIYSLNVTEDTTTPDRISLTKIGGYSVGTTNKEGGVAEIIKYNRDNGKFYLVNGSTHPASVDIVNLKNGSNPEKEKSINVELLSETGGFNYGDLTSVDINPATKHIAVAIQEEDAMKPGKVLVLSYEGELLAAYDTGVQPDMVKYTADGRYILTADEAEPRSVEGDPEGSVTIIDTLLNTDVSVKFDNPALIDDLVHIRGAVDPVTKLITGEGSKADAVRDLEPEFIQLSDDQKTAYVSLQENNAIATIDIVTKSVLSVNGLGFKNLNEPANALDLLKDKQVKLDNVPFYGTYMPDGIDQYTVGGKTYLFTANEGDATEWDSKENVSTIGKMKASLNPDSKAAKFLSANSQYDGVEVMSDMGHDGIYLYGARSFSVWDASTMTQVYDSGSDFEKITGERLPDYFNASNSNTTLDNRSTKKGPEPEYVKIGKVGQKALAFVGLERIGGLMTYDVTNPEQPSFVNYINSREFTPKDNLATDTGPEGIEFIPATASPTGLPLVLVANEVGGTVAIYQLNVAKVTLDQPSLSLKAGGATATLQATVVPVGDGAKTITWSSSNSSIASVDNAGKVTPLSQGTVTVSAFSADGYGVAESLVSVAAADSVSTPGSGAGLGTVTIPVEETDSPAVITEGNKVIVELKTTADAEGRMVASVTLEKVEAALKLLVAAAGGDMIFRTTAANTSGEIILNIPAAAAAAIAGSTASVLTFETGLGTISLNRTSFAAVSAAANGEDITLSIARINSSTAMGSLAPEIKASAEAKIGNRPILDLTIHAGSQIISSFAGGVADISIPYVPAGNEDVNAVVAYYMTETGQLDVLPGSSYDASSGVLSFKTTHFSTYAVGYNKVAFSDIGSSFAKDSISYLAARSIITGIGDGKFGLKGNLTRADAALLLSHMAGVELGTATAATGSFTDVKESDYYADAVNWANQSGIVSGIGDGRFDPKASVTRQQLAVMMIRFADFMDWTLPVSAKPVAFADQQSISAYALAAAAAAQQAGIISGKTNAGGQGVNFAPQDKASREETAKMLATLLKLGNQ